MAVRAKDLLEREAVVDAATGLLDLASAGNAGALFVLAEPGLGKTSVLDTACLHAKDAFSIAIGKGDAMETALPFGLMAQTLSALGGGDVLDGNGPGPSGPDQRAARFNAVRRWLERAAPKPALVAIDDLHWADADSLALLSFLCRRMAPLPVAVIATLRPWPTSARLVAEALAHDGYASIQRLEPLSSDGAAELLAEHARRPLDTGEVERAVQICAGNPLLLEQVALAVARGEQIPHSDADGARGVHERLLLGRFAGLPADALGCARAGAVFGIRFRPDLAVLLADLGQREADGALEALERAGLVRPSRAGRVEFVHPLFRQALYDDLGESVRTRFHARAFALLAERGLDEEAVEHAIKADLAGNETAIAVMERVGRAARRAGATESAMSVLAAAAALAGANANAQLLSELTDVWSTGGRSAAAADVGERVLLMSGLPTMIRARTLRALARAYAYLGNLEAAARRIGECVDLTEAVAPEFAVQTLLSYGRVCEYTDGPAASVALMDRARTIARNCDAPFRWSADAAWGYAALETGDPSGLQAAEAASTAAEAAARTVVAGSGTVSRKELLVGGGALNTFGTAAKYLGRLSDSERIYQVTLRITERIGSVDEEAAALVGYMGTLQRMLRLADAAAMTERCAKLADLAPLAGPYAAVNRAILLLLSGRLAESEESARQAETVVTALRVWQPSLSLDYGRAWRCLAEGRLAEACELYERMETVSARVGLRDPCEVPWARHGIAAYVGSGRRADAERVLAWLDDAATNLPCRWPRLAAAHGRALLAEAAGDQARADEEFQRAMAVHDELDWPLERLQTVLEYGRFLRRSGQLPRARRLLGQAAEIAEAAGALWLAGQARQELRVAGGRRREKADPARLTPQEERVARLAATEASNAEIAAALYVSVNTVETHLRHIYGKLGIRSRRQLPAALPDR